VRYAEVFFDPQMHVGREVPFESVVRGYHRALQDAERELGVAGALIMCILRGLPADSAMATLEAALPYKDMILGLGLDSEERGNPPAKFVDVFARGRAEGLRLTMHCDIDQENITQHIRQALEDIRVERLDHVGGPRPSRGSRGRPGRDAGSSRNGTQQRPGPAHIGPPDRTH
jgi:adenosine deaminase